MPVVIADPPAITAKTSARNMQNNRCRFIEDADSVVIQNFKILLILPGE
jgi:hypothetical protein